MSVANTHTFEIGETFGKEIEDEEIEISDVKDETVVYHFKIDGEILSTREKDKQTARLFIQTGYWK